MENATFVLNMFVFFGTGGDRSKQVIVFQLNFVSPSSPPLKKMKKSKFSMKKSVHARVALANFTNGYKNSITQPCTHRHTYVTLSAFAVGL